MAHEASEPPRRLRTHGSIGTSLHGTTRGVLRNTYTVTSLAAEGVRASLTATPLALFPSQGSPGEIQQGAWLATYPYSLRLPRGSPRSDLGSVRSAHSGGAALVLHQLPCSPHPRVRHPRLLRPVSSWGTIPPSSGPRKSNCAAGAVRVVQQGVADAVIEAGEEAVARSKEAFTVRSISRSL